MPSHFLAGCLPVCDVPLHVSAGVEGADGDERIIRHQRVGAGRHLLKALFVMTEQERCKLSDGQTRQSTRCMHSHIVCC